jgi:hypothetical protein
VNEKILPGKEYQDPAFVSREASLTLSGFFRCCFFSIQEILPHSNWRSVFELVFSDIEMQRVH